MAPRLPTSHVTRTPLSRSKGQRSRSPGRFTHCGVYAQAAAAVSVRTYLAWETAATLPSAGAAVGSAARGATAPIRGGEGRGHIVSPRAQLVIIVIIIITAIIIMCFCLMKEATVCSSVTEHRYSTSTRRQEVVSDPIVRLPLS